MAAHGRNAVNRIWYGASPLSLVLLPLGWLYRLVVRLRRQLYVAGLKASFRIDIPVVVVGNLTAGGTGKTPVTIWLVESLQMRGLRPGVVSRGYGGHAGDTPLDVTARSDPSVAGDEPVLVARRCGCPVVVHPDRVAAARRLVELGVDVVIADDGLQHYRLSRDYEIVVVDGARGFGNGRPLPAGPLREPLSRLDAVQRVLVNGEVADPGLLDLLPAARTRRLQLCPTAFRQLGSDRSRATDGFANRRVHAVAGIGHPQRFFDLLRSLGVDVIPHPLPDHAAIHAADLEFGDGLPVVMTEKDAVKCAAFAGNDCWYLSVDADLVDDDMLEKILALLPVSTASM